MAQNLNFDIGEGCHFHDNDPKNGEKYGRLYTWEAAKKACPPGWHLPSDDEWWWMIMEYGGASNSVEDQEENIGGKAAYKALVKGGDSGFSALLGGYRGNRYSNKEGGYWSSTRMEDVYNTALYYAFTSSKYLNRNGCNKKWGLSCRYIQD